ncbi:MAG: vitamin K epoxide reductase family protein [Intrasporangium sp.]|uniref:vitamin K epoxide reductase family protein n=1 Tax=Intrasporangium sp. TaxID=1925024 RepID=UPI0026488161|nr:vitamin K epoxide reductase family protein [Intrasporangium sp.]MDN5796425.1 vitamin K epoxide reductase family protein [Intrasporangium sp.]
MTRSTRSTAATVAPRERPGWLVPTSLVLVGIGLLTSAYLTYEHFTDNATLACTANGVVDCVKVTSSEWSTLFGIPMALLGLVFFAVLLVLCWPAVWRRGEAWLDGARLGWLTIGLGMVVYLVWAEVSQIHAICLWCTVVHTVTFLLWVAVMFGQILSGPPSSAVAAASGPSARRGGRR